MSDVYKLQYNGMTLAYPGWNGYVSFENDPIQLVQFGAYANATATLAITATKDEQTTAWNNNGGTAFNEIPLGSEITVTSDVPTYWRVDAGTPSGVSGWTTATYSRGFSAHGYVTADGYATTTNTHKNAFTASGGWEKGSNVSTAGKGAYSKNVGPFYAITSYHTSNVPTAWYATSNRWKVTSTVSAYNITLAPKMTFTGKCNIIRAGMTAAATGVSLIGSTQTQSQNWSTNATAQQTWNYSKSFTSNTTSVNYGISGKIAVNGSTASLVTPSAGYIASKTTGTWTATGYIP